MENTERQKFEENWRDVFEAAEAQPSENLWEGIEQKLEHDGMRKRVVFYQRLAAACVLFSLVAGAFGLYWRNEHHTQLAQTNSPKEKTDKITAIEKSNAPSVPSAKQNEAATLTSETKSVQEQNETVISNSKPSVIKKNSKEDGGSLADNNGIDQRPGVPVSKNSDNSLVKTTGTFAEKEKTNSVTSPYSYSYAFVSDVDETAPLIAINLKGGPRNAELVRKLPAMPSVFMDRPKEKYGEKWWAAAGASAGAYSPNSNSASTATASMYQVGSFASPSSSAASNYGTSYSVALTAAHRVSKRWVLQSGMQYMARSIDYTSNFINTTGSKSSASLADYVALHSNASTVSTPYQLESKSEYISIPLQAGYLLVDRKFGLLINSGVSSDIFIRNTLTDLSGQRSSYSESAGQNSPYRTFMWSALMSTELSYKMGGHYRLALVPGMRYSLNQVLKSDQSSQGNPMIWDVGFRFRYIFK